MTKPTERQIAVIGHLMHVAHKTDGSALNVGKEFAQTILEIMAQIAVAPSGDLGQLALIVNRTPEGQTF